MRTFEVTRGWRYEGYEGGVEDSLILVDGVEIGGVYRAEGNPAINLGWGWADGPAAGACWISWGPRGLSCGHKTREGAEQAQVREYATNPDLHDRLLAEARAEREREQAVHEAAAEGRQRQREAERRRARLGDDAPGPTIWSLPAYHALYGPIEEVDAVSAWLRQHDVAASSTHEIRVEQRDARRVIVFEQPRLLLRSRGAPTETHVVTLTADPPPINTPARPDLVPVLEEHWPVQYPLHDYGFGTWCSHCSKGWDPRAGDPVPWPCADIENAATSVGGGQ